MDIEKIPFEVGEQIVLKDKEHETRIFFTPGLIFDRRGQFIGLLMNGTTLYRQTLQSLYVFKKMTDAENDSWRPFDFGE